MLVLSRMANEAVVVIDQETGEEIGRVEVVKQAGKRTVLGFDFAKRFLLLRPEVVEREMEASGKK